MDDFLQLNGEGKYTLMHFTTTFSAVVSLDYIHTWYHYTDYLNILKMKLKRIARVGIWT